MFPDPAVKPLLSVEETAAALGEGEKAIRSAIEAGHIPHIRIGRYVRVPVAPLRVLLGIDPENSEGAPVSAPIALADRVPAKEIDRTHHASA
jgi:excisionase family DNA binding protein